MRKIFFTPLAIEHLQSIYEYIAEDNQYYAEEVLQKIHHSIDFLEHFPLIWTVIEGDTRYLVEPKYRDKVIYRVYAETIEIVSISKYREKWQVFDIE